jgi:cytochrome o ubiquinol oxidase subunit 1
VSGDPWNGRTLEWATSSPPPEYNFAVLPHIHALDHFHHAKEEALAMTPPVYKDIHMPRYTSAGFFIAAFMAVVGFAAIWHIWWAVIVGMIGMVVTVIIRCSDNDIDYYIPAAEIRATEEAHLRRVELAEAN